MPGPVLVATAVPAERDAILAGLAGGESPLTVVAVGVGPVAAAAGTARLLALAEAHGVPYQMVISAGVAGGFPGRAPVGATVVATRSVAADLGADSPAGFLSLDELGFGSTVAPIDPVLAATLRTALPDAVAGAVLTVSTVTGTAGGTGALAARYPDAVAEAMEGYGVACAASISGVAFAELRTISNAVGPRDRGSWRIDTALAALRAAAPALAALPDLASASPAEAIPEPSPRGAPDRGDAPDRSDVPRTGGVTPATVTR